MLFRGYDLGQKYEIEALEKRRCLSAQEGNGAQI